MQPVVRRMIGWMMTVAGGFLVVFGVWAVLAYVWGVIEVLGEADQSWVFWGLAILFIGIVALAGGVVLVLAGRRLLHRTDTDA